MKRKVLTIISLVVFLSGIVVLLYPIVAKEINTHKSDSIIDNFKKDVEALNNTSNSNGNSDSNNDSSTSTEKSTEKATADDTTMYYEYQVITEQVITEQVTTDDKPTPEMIAKLYNDLQKYNQDLYKNGQQEQFANSFIFEDETVDLSGYGISNGMVGYISIPAIDLNLPLYLGANEENMLMGVAQLNKTSAPIGGESTNCAIAGHRGLVNQIMFDNIVYLNKGDDLYIHNYWGDLHYRVRETKIIDPSNTSEILIEEGKDLVTLITCHPYGYVTERYLVICERVE
jgi:sortase A